MPEGHTVHRAARDQSDRLAGQVVRVDSPQGRFSESAATIWERIPPSTDPLLLMRK